MRKLSVVFGWENRQAFPINKSNNRPHSVFNTSRRFPKDEVAHELSRNKERTPKKVTLETRKGGEQGVLLKTSTTDASYANLGKFPTR